MNLIIPVKGSGSQEGGGPLVRRGLGGGGAAAEKIGVDGEGG